MGVLDDVQRLKAQRREQLAAQQREREEAEAARNRESAERLDAAVRAALAQESAESLYAFIVPHLDPFDRMRRYYHVEFHIPGHRPISMLVGAVEESRGEWLAATDTGNHGNGGTLRWSATALNEYGEHQESYADLSDALIAAEIEGWTPPVAVPTPVRPSPEAERKAADAWVLMLAHAMPPEIALGFVEEETAGDVAAAAAAIVWSAVAHLANSRPEEILATSAQVSAGTATGVLLMGEYDRAARIVGDFVTHINALELSGRRGDDQDKWREWCETAKRTIALIREVTAAANPARAA